MLHIKYNKTKKMYLKKTFVGNRTYFLRSILYILVRGELQMS